MEAYDPIRAPWEAVAGPVEGLWHVLPVERTGSTVPVATIDHSRDGYEPTRLGAEKEARLIASAPDLLGALKEARSQLEAYELERSGEAYNSLQINAAIAKAEAGQ